MKYSENYEFNLPNKADNDPADIDLLSENFELIDEILKRHEGFIGNNANVLEKNEVTLETSPSEIPAGVTYCFVNQSNFVDNVWQVGLLVNYNSNRETDAYRVFQVWYGQLESSPMQRKSQLSSGSLVWGEFEKYATKSDLTKYVVKNQGASNVGKILVVGTDGNLTLTDMPEGGASGDVTGVLDEANNILLSGNLADGTYTLKYENADGTYTEIGTLEVGAIPEPVEPVTENITLTDGIRVGSDGGDRTQAGCCATPHIDLTNIPKPCTIHLTGARWAFYDTAATGHIMYYATKADGSKLAGGYTNDSIGDGYFSLVRNGGGENETDVTVTVTSNEVATIRFGGVWTTVDPNTMQAKATLTYTPNA